MADTEQKDIQQCTDEEIYKRAVLRVNIVKGVWLIKWIDRRIEREREHVVSC